MSLINNKTNQELKQSAEEFKQPAQKLTESEFKALQTLIAKRNQLVVEYGNTKIESIHIQKRMIELESELETLLQEDTDLINSFNAKYGLLKINIETGEFFKA